MSLSNAISNAVSGIVAASRGTEVVASNLANALTPGYARRELQQSARSYLAGGGGVQVDGVARAVRNSVLAQGRLASADAARAGTLADFHKSMADALGVPGQAGALTTLLSEFEAALVSASARPENESGLARALSAASALAGAYQSIGNNIQQARTTADQAIAQDVATLNSGLEQVAELNRQIAMQMTAGGDANALQDERQRLIDQLAEIVPLKELPRENGRVALFTANGGVLLDGTEPARFGFTAAGPVTAGMAVGASALGLLSVNGEEIPAAQMGRYAGGRLAANFQIRDVDAPLAQARLDAAALDLHDRFADSTLDPTLGASDPGLFTDAGALVLPPPAPGLAQRLTLNPALDPAAGGDIWRLRDGLRATAPGPAGASGLLVAMKDALGASRASTLPGLSARPRTAAVLASELTSLAASGRIDAERVLGAAAVQSSTYASLLQQDGVDSDKEMETLLALERAYASNARVLQAVDEMIQTILRLT
ncbi:MAG TPA: flagellar hook-associated protein FlgK [Paracoccus solventivorans]|uniref:Flagellar hook-associated protein 1 n=1 Tax=Paracoccus solventivorans TaxID=53463 RepID=A0A832QXR1_9RHOB|nr:flagellar hook-associated protein FlgK [Paracoccus solventivorans]HHW35251.1 flagellar hook-associated protein FlgK [Paracoccus solventivorans]